MITIIKKLLSFFAMFEGFDHLILSAISFWGFYKHGLDPVHYWALWITPVADTIFGITSIATGFVLNKLLNKKK